MNTASQIREARGESLLRLALAAVVSHLFWQEEGLALPPKPLLPEAAAAPAYEYQSFDAPVVPVGSTEISPLSINVRGQVTGHFLEFCTSENCGRPHGFVFQEGKLTGFDVPGAMATSPSSINDSGQVAGSFLDASGNHGFVYGAGTFTTLDLPGAPRTDAASINDRGEVTGTSYDASLSGHGYLYTAGKFTTLDAPGAEGGTRAFSINDRGQVTGDYSDTAGSPAGHGFLYAEGTFTTLDAPDASATNPASINNSGTVTGGYRDASGQHGFLYSAGAFTTLDVPGAQLTTASDINDSGQLTGHFIDGTGIHGFVYNAGRFIILDVPEATTTYAQGINDTGQITGWYADASRRLHGFIATPVVAVLDDFNREDGRLGPDWKGKAGVSAYRIVDQQISVGTGGPVYWQPNPFGLDQEAFVKLTRIDPQGAEQGLLLKVQGDTGNYRKGAIAVKYDAARQVIRVATWRPRKASWRNYRDLPVAFADGDKLGARVLADGKVRIFRNDQRVGRITLGPVDRQFFNERTGRAGLWFENAAGAIVDDFGGGTRMQ